MDMAHSGDMAKETHETIRHDIADMLNYSGYFSTHIVEDVFYFLSSLSHPYGLLCGILDKPPLCISIIVFTSLWTTP